MTLNLKKSFLRYDSIHGDFQGSVTADPENNALIINGNCSYYHGKRTRGY
jgi:glyceraldehyde 3-phosphate dehydrogenase